LNNPGNGTLNHGALIFTPTKELCSQVYNNLKGLDSKNQLKMYRTTSLSYNYEHTNQVSYCDTRIWRLTTTS
jgi:superfamily II DNA/RNA helicase